jgi:hypothetical protein
MGRSPRELATLDLGASRPAVTPIEPAGGDPESALSIVGGAAWCHDARGKLLWTCHPPGLNFTSVNAARDLNGDGRAEILLAAGRPAEPYAAAVLLSAADGSVLWRYDVEPMSYAWYLHLGHYLPGDAGWQIIVLMHGYPPDKDNGYIALFEWPSGQAAPRRKWRYAFSEYTCFPTLLQSDLDGDGAAELAVESHSRMWFLDAVTGGLKQFVRWDVSPANMRSYGLTRFCDLDGDGRDDFICLADFAQHHEVLLNRGGRLEKAWHYGWAESVTTGKVVTTWPEPAWADVDGDGRLEVVVSMYNSEGEKAWLVRIYDAVTGSIKYRIPGFIAAACADLDGDGAAEIGGNTSRDPTRSVLDGGRVFRITANSVAAAWRDDRARVTGGGKSCLRVQSDGHEQLLDLDGQGRPRLVPSRPPAPATRPAGGFAAIPAILGPPPPVLLSGDFTGAGINDLVCYQEPRVRLFRLQAGRLEPAGQYESSCAPVIADLDGDGRSELVLTTAGPAGPPVVEAVVPVTGDRLWRSVFPKTERQGLPAPRKAYARSIRLAGRATPDLYVWAGTPVVRSTGLDGASGRILWERGECPGIERFWGPSVNFAAARDCNGDGREDLVFTNPDYYCVCDGATGEMLLGPVQPTTIFKQPSQGLYTCPVILDDEARGPTVCLVAGHYFQGVMSLRAEPRWYCLPVVGAARTGGEGFLRGPGGAWLMGFGRQNGRFACIDVASGAVRWELDLRAAASDVISGDVDGDGRDEFVLGTSHGRLLAVGDGGSGPRVLWEHDLSSSVAGPILADLTGDGRCEVVCATADGRLHVLGE